MVKRNIVKNPSAVKYFFRVFLEKSASVLLSLIEKINVNEWIKGLLNLRNNIMKYTIVLILSITSLVMIMLGADSYITSQIPELGNGLGKILIGLVLAIGAFIYNKVR